MIDFGSIEMAQIHTEGLEIFEIRYLVMGARQIGKSTVVKQDLKSLF